ncbi:MULTISPECIES: dimethylsulfoniopropionate lyase [Sinorhizobium]|uniref:Transcriptional regulator n=1 Tax=Sinorhizobium americanum TaxID=194963 RepID=A0A2S3YTX6_9HYPH|nr:MULTISPECIES: dimethylsulfoniopropionate lyase [Sinorhizobium]PDT38821.1 transcriptional regulator [Sinorhizobium sp. FG01]PDT51098.1 transcriptional regulator [Sinorhizobium sp. NG07B]POH25461.1 transcriptional regulator [Sinorhizobium americanum]POH35091.1 transcriptional regulator [Sinorhizobium americanum]
MTARSEALQSFVDAASAAFDQFAQATESRGSIAQIFSALEVPGVQRPGPGSRLPVCVHLDTALAVETQHDALRRLVDRFKTIEPLLEWRRRTNYDGSESENFFEGHANAMIIGPGGLEERRDLWFGVTLMAPDVRYPDHDHPPEEVYLVLSEGEFRQGQGAWFSPGVGGSFYNQPGTRHAMRSVGTPLFAFWVLLANGPA